MVVSHWSALGLCNELMTVVRRMGSADSPGSGISLIGAHGLRMGQGAFPRGKWCPDDKLWKAGMHHILLWEGHLASQQRHKNGKMKATKPEFGKSFAT